MAVGVQDPLALHCSETCFGKPVRPPPSAKMTEASAREAVAELWPSPGNLFREARRASPQRENNGARACVRRRGFATAVAEASAVARKVVSGSPTGQLPAPKLERRAPSEAVAEALAVAQKVFLGSPTGPTPASKRRERAFGQPDGPDPSPNLRRFFALAKNGTRHARAGFLRTLNPKRF